MVRPMSQKLTPLALALAALGLLACGDDTDGPVDLGIDAGSASDLGTTSDLGTATPDAGMRPDSGLAPDTGFVYGDPIEATPGVWSWIDFPDSRCMNDTPTGIGVNLAGSGDKVIIFLMGGNACFDYLSCQITAYVNGFGLAEFNQDQYRARSAPLFNRLEPENPFSDWSYVFVPYCTGDIHAGANPSANVGGQNRNFHGYLNMREYLSRLVPTFPNATEVLLTGVSAGGFGSAFNFTQVQQAFGPDVRVTLIDDSGPPMGETYLPPCLQKHWRDLWGLDFTLPENCEGCFSDQRGVFAEPLIDHIQATFPDRNFGFISSSEDSVIRQFWAYGQDNCALLNGGGNPGSLYPAANFRAGLMDLRDRILGPSGRGKLYMPDAAATRTQHVWLGERIWQVEHHGVRLSDWMLQAIAGDPGWAHAPAP